MDELEPRPDAYRVGRLRVENRAADLWAIVDGAEVLNHDGKWEFEPQPSSRTPEFLMRCRFLFDDAIAWAQKMQRR